MAFLQDLGKKISEGVQEASKKTSELLEISKLNSNISAEKDGINATKVRIGDKMFNLFNTGEALPEVLNEDFQDIINRLAKIGELESKIADIKASSEAAKAASAVAAEPAIAAGTTFCSGCGTPMPAGTVFCSKCGKRAE